jgi:hypothetical protein
MRERLLPRVPILNPGINVEESGPKIVLHLPGRGKSTLSGALARAFIELRPFLDGTHPLETVLEALAESWEPADIEGLVSMLFMRNLVREASDPPPDEADSELAVRLPLRFDPTALERDLRGLADVTPVAQPSHYHSGEWAGVALYSPGGRADTASTDATADPSSASPLLARCPYFQEVIEAFRCPKITVRLLQLPPGARIDYHTDRALNFQHGMIRVHVPIVTHPEVVFYIAHRRFSWKPGETWYGDFSFPHMVENRSQIVRVHMVLDLVVDDFVLGLFPRWFVDKKRAEGITVAPPPHPLAEAELRRFSCDLEVPRQYFPVGPVDAERVPIQLRMVNQRLMALYDGRPYLGLQAISPSEFIFVGRGNGLVLRFDVEGERPRMARLVAKGLPSVGLGTAAFFESWLDEDVQLNEVSLDLSPVVDG